MCFEGPFELQRGISYCVVEMSLREDSKEADEREV